MEPVGFHADGRRETVFANQAFKTGDATDVDCAGQRFGLRVAGTRRQALGTFSQKALYLTSEQQHCP